MLFLVKKQFSRRALACLLIALSSSTHAVEFHVDGFGSAVVGRAVHQAQSTGGVDSTYLANTPDGFYDDDWDITPDSIVGLQVLAQFNDTFSVTAQTTAQGQDDFDLALEWAYLTYHITPNTRVLAGRQRLPLFYFSDFLDVGYAYHFVRPPQEVYDLPFDDFEGLQLEHTFNIEDWDGRFQLYAGNTEDTLTKPVNTAELNDIVGGVFSIGNDWLRVRASYLQGDLSSKFISRGGITQNNSNAIATLFLGFALDATLDDILLLTEVTRIEFGDPFGPDQGLGGTQITGWYISAGYQLNKLTPYIVYAENTLQLDQENIAFTQLGLNNQDLASTAWTIGLRWDFMQQIALKTEYIQRHDHSSGAFQRIFGKGREVDIFTLGFHAIF